MEKLRYLDFKDISWKKYLPSLSYTPTRPEGYNWCPVYIIPMIPVMVGVAPRSLACVDIRGRIILTPNKSWNIQRGHNCKFYLFQFYFTAYLNRYLLDNLIENNLDFFLFWTDILIMYLTSLSETSWKFGLTPLPSLRSKAHKVIWEILLYIRAQFAFKLGHANFYTCINC